MSQDECGTSAPFEGLPLPRSLRLLNFDTAALHTVRGRHILVVCGQKPYVNMQVWLMPMMYILQPDYCEIEVVGHLDGIGLPVLSPYMVERDITHMLGTLGIDVQGANKSQRIKIEP